MTTRTLQRTRIRRPSEVNTMGFILILIVRCVVGSEPGGSTSVLFLLATLFDPTRRQWPPFCRLFLQFLQGCLFLLLLLLEGKIMLYNVAYQKGTIYISLNTLLPRQDRRFFLWLS
jgi:hypothetical protein